MLKKFAKRMFIKPVDGDNRYEGLTGDGILHLRTAKPSQNCPPPFYKRRSWEFCVS
jgi:hypothetical protein